MHPMETEFAAAASELQQDPTEILRTLRSWYIPEDDSWSWSEGDEPEWVPESIVEVEEAEVDCSGWTAVVQARCSDEEQRRLKVTYSVFHGSFDEPPSDELNIEVL